MPFFKTTQNILKTPWEDELHDDNWFDKPTITLPPYLEWDYRREMKIEDVDIWEVIYQQGGGLGVYAAYSPMAEFYMITMPNKNATGIEIETYYGPSSQKTVIEKMKKLKIPFTLNKIIISSDDAWKFNGLVVE